MGVIKKRKLRQLAEHHRRSRNELIRGPKTRREDLNEYELKQKKGNRNGLRADVKLDGAGGPNDWKENEEEEEDTKTFNWSKNRVAVVAATCNNYCNTQTTVDNAVYTSS